MGISHALTGSVNGNDKSKPYIDVMENVFGGVHITTDREPKSGDREPDLRARPWLTGVSMAEVNVKLSKDDEDPER